MPIEKFQNKYTIKSARLQGYDYSQDGMYFVTICTREKEHFFGEVIEEKMILSGIGKIVKEEWLHTPIIRSDVILDGWVVMPNHLHGIIEIYSDRVNTPAVETPRRGVSTRCGGYNHNWKPNSLGSIVNQFKSVCTKRIWKFGSPEFHWQSRYYDHIIRSEDSLNRIREYIIKNPRMWERDRNNLENLLM